MKKNINKGLIVSIIFTILFSLFMYAIAYRGGNAFGLQNDYFSQHFMFADFLRQDFWQRGNLFPDFSLNIGSGINYFDLSYYGYMRPDILLSFLFPFIDTHTWIIIVCFIAILLNVIFMYKWIYYHTKNSYIACFVSCLFCLTPAIYRNALFQTVFLLFMPWVVLLFYSLDRFNDKKYYKYFVIIATVLLILYSFYYAVGSLIIAGLYVLLGIRKDNIKNCIEKIIFMFLGCLIASFFLIPTIIETFTNARKHMGPSYNLIDLLKPSYIIEDLFIEFNNFESPAMFIIGVFALVFNLIYPQFKNQKLSVFCIIILIFPIFRYVFSGFDYLLGKTLLPLIPMLMLVVSLFLQTLSKKDSKIYHYILITTLITIFLLFIYNKQGRTRMVIDLIALLMMLFLYLSTNKKALMFLYLCIPLSYSHYVIKSTVNMGKMLRSVYQQYPNTKAAVNQVLANTHQRMVDYRNMKNENSYYYKNGFTPNLYSSIVNKNYVEFLENDINYPHDTISHVIKFENDPLVQFYFGIDKVLANKKEDILNHNILLTNNKEEAQFNVYQTKTTLPLVYASYNNISQQEYHELLQNAKIDALMNYGIVQQGNTTYQNHLQAVDTSGSAILPPELRIAKLDNGNIKIYADDNITINYHLNNPIKDILMINFDLVNVVNESQADHFITINNQSNIYLNTTSVYANGDNKFSYRLSNPQGLSDLTIEFSKGEYEIANVLTNTISVAQLQAREDSITPLTIESLNGPHQVLKGNINSKEDGYLLTSIPYQNGFSLKIDQKEVPVLNVNCGFVGAKLTKGEHQVELSYTPPGKTIGIIISLASLIGLCIYMIYRLKKDKMLSK